jgi:hypothetical protein
MKRPNSELKHFGYIQRRNFGPDLRGRKLFDKFFKPKAKI